MCGINRQGRSLSRRDRLSAYDYEISSRDARNRLIQSVPAHQTGSSYSSDSTSRASVPGLQPAQDMVK
jgi:hypothetical protein